MESMLATNDLGRILHGSEMQSAKEGFNVVSRFDLAKTSMQVPTSATNQEVIQSCELMKCIPLCRHPFSL